MDRASRIIKSNLERDSKKKKAERDRKETWQKQSVKDLLEHNPLHRIRFWGEE